MCSGGNAPETPLEQRDDAFLTGIQKPGEFTATKPQELAPIEGDPSSRAYIYAMNSRERRAQQAAYDQAMADYNQQQDQYNQQLDQYNRAQAEITRRAEPARIAQERQDLITKNQQDQADAQRQMEAQAAAQAKQQAELEAQQAQRLAEIKAQGEANAARSSAASQSMQILGQARGGAAPTAKLTRGARGAAAPRRGRSSLSIAPASQTAGAGPNLSV